MNSSYKRLRDDLDSLGVCHGDFLVVHSSLKSMGYVEGGAECVVSALRDAVGDKGTLLFPTFTYRSSYNDSFFSNELTPSCVGLISEVFRKTDGVKRSNHPTHSVAIRGPLTAELFRDEELDDTPMGEHSPYRRLATFKAKILMLGCSIRHNSYMHALEEEGNVIYSLREHQQYTVVNESRNTYLRMVRRHNFVRPNGLIVQRYDRAVSVVSDDDIKNGFIHGAESIMFDSVALREKVLRKMKEDPLYFVDDEGGFYPELKK